jgi:sugar lactone lactonase YvrE
VTDVRCVAECRDHLGEGPCWVASEDRLYWFDIQGKKLRWLKHGDQTQGVFDLPWRASVAAPRAAGGLILVTEAGLAHFDTASGACEVVSPVALPPGFRTNDGKIDVQGRLWWSSMDDDGGKRPGVLYRTDPDGRTEVALEGIHIANTVSCSPDGATLYFADSARRRLWAFPVGPDGRLGERRDFVSTEGEAGAPDGSAVDAEGYVWNAQWGAWRIVRYAPDGRADRIVTFPVAQVSSCAFGGPDLSTLYVTTAWENMDAAGRSAQPQAGDLFAFEPGVRGLPLPVFAG